MKFWEAIKCLEEGKKITRTYWEKDAYIYIDDDNILRDNYNTAQDLYYIPNDNDDWEVYEEKKEAPCALKKLAIDLMQFDSDVNSMVDKEDIGLISTLLVKLNEKYDIY